MAIRARADVRGGADLDGSSGATKERLCRLGPFRIVFDHPDLGHQVWRRRVHDRPDLEARYATDDDVRSSIRQAGHRLHVRDRPNRATPDCLPIGLFFPAHDPELPVTVQTIRQHAPVSRFKDVKGAMRLREQHQRERKNGEASDWQGRRRGGGAHR